MKTLLLEAHSIGVALAVPNCESAHWAAWFLSFQDPILMAGTVHENMDPFSEHTMAVRGRAKPFPFGVATHHVAMHADSVLVSR